MISVITCSRSFEYYQLLAENIANTIGTVFELIKIDNEFNEYNISSAYNQGASRAIYPYLCFAHEDIWFTQNDWGVKLIEHFNTHTEVGLIGIAGAVYKGIMPCGWWESEAGNEEIRRMRITHQKSPAEAVEEFYINPRNEKVSEVVLIDGVFMATKKSIWEENRFDERLIRGFHGYDLDLSFQIRRTKKILVTYDIGIVHFSTGKKDKAWMDAMLDVHEKWKDVLPFKAGDFNNRNTNEYENNVRRLRKNMVAYMQYEKSFFPLLGIYGRYFSFVGKGPGTVAIAKEYFSGILKIAKAFFGKNR